MLNQDEYTWDNIVRRSLMRIGNPDEFHYDPEIVIFNILLEYPSFLNYENLAVVREVVNDTKFMESVWSALPSIRTHSTKELHHSRESEACIGFLIHCAGISFEEGYVPWNGLPYHERLGQVCASEAMRFKHSQGDIWKLSDIISGLCSPMALMSFAHGVEMAGFTTLFDFQGDKIEEERLNFKRNLLRQKIDLSRIVNISAKINWGIEYNPFHGPSSQIWGDLWSNLLDQNHY